MITLKPDCDFDVLVSLIVVSNDVKLQLKSDFLVYLAQKDEPLLVAITRCVVSEHLALKLVQSDKESHRSVPLVVISPSANMSLTQRQSLLRAFESLTLTLFIATEHHYLL